MAQQAKAPAAWWVQSPDPTRQRRDGLLKVVLQPSHVCHACTHKTKQFNINNKKASTYSTIECLLSKTREGEESGIYNHH